jgi:hypothetical protein
MAGGLRVAIASFLLALVIVVSLVLLPAFLGFLGAVVGPDSAESRAYLVQAQVAAVALLFQLVGAVALGLGLFYTAQTLRVNQEGQITDRFTKAVDQLGSSQMRVRIGGIFALQRIASDSERDYWPIIEVLCAYARESEEPPRIDETLEVPVIEAPHDIQIIADVLKRRKHYLGHGETERINLRLADLRGASLGFPSYEHGIPAASHWEGAIFDRAKLDHVHFTGCHLDGANFGFASLEGASFFYACLDAASFDGANLAGARFHQSSLVGAVLIGANLEGADLEDANLNGAYLDETVLDDAYLLGADLRESKGLTQEQIDLTFMDETTKLPPGLHLSSRTAERWSVRVGAIPERGGRGTID